MPRCPAAGGIATFHAQVGTHRSLRLGAKHSSRNDRGQNWRRSRGALKLADPLEQLFLFCAQIPQPVVSLPSNSRFGVRLFPLAWGSCSALQRWRALFPGQGHHWPKNNANPKSLSKPVIKNREQSHFAEIPIPRKTPTNRIPGPDNVCAPVARAGKLESFSSVGLTICSFQSSSLSSLAGQGTRRNLLAPKLQFRNSSRA